MAQTRGLTDPYAAQIVGAANTVMQGVNSMQQMQQNEREQKWQQELRQRQRKKWQEEDQASKVYSHLMGVASGGQQAERQATQQEAPAQPPQSPAGAPDISPQAQAGPRLQGLSGRVPRESFNPQDGAAKDQDGTKRSKFNLTGKGGNEQQAEQGTQQGQIPDPDTQVLEQAAPTMQELQERLKQMDLDKLDPGAVRKGMSKAIQDTMDRLQFSKANMEMRQAKWERERQELRPQAVQALAGFQQGDPGSVEQLVNVANKLPNGFKFNLDREGDNLMVWDVAEAKSPENARKIPLSEVTFEQARDFIVPVLDPENYQQQMMADMRAAKEHNQEEMANPYVLRHKKTGDKLYLARTIDRRKDNKLHPTISNSPIFLDARMMDPGDVDLTNYENLGRADEIEGQGSEQRETRELKQGDKILTQELTEDGWQTISEAPRWKDTAGVTRKDLLKDIKNINDSISRLQARVNIAPEATQPKIDQAIDRLKKAKSYYSQALSDKMSTEELGRKLAELDVDMDELPGGNRDTGKQQSQQSQQKHQEHQEHQEQSAGAKAQGIEKLLQDKEPGYYEYKGKQYRWDGEQAIEVD